MERVAGPIPGLDSVLADSCGSATRPRPQTKSLSVSCSDGGAARKECDVQEKKTIPASHTNIQGFVQLDKTAEPQTPIKNVEELAEVF